MLACVTPGRVCVSDREPREQATTNDIIRPYSSHAHDNRQIDFCSVLNIFRWHCATYGSSYQIHTKLIRIFRAFTFPFTVCNVIIMRGPEMNEEHPNTPTSVAGCQLIQSNIFDFDWLSSPYCLMAGPNHCLHWFSCLNMYKTYILQRMCVKACVSVVVL